MTEEERKAANQQMVDNAVNLVKGWTRPLVFIYFSAILGIMLVTQGLDSIGWQFWVVYGGVGGSWLGEGAINLISKVKK